MIIHYPATELGIVSSRYTLTKVSFGSFTVVNPAHGSGSIVKAWPNPALPTPLKNSQGREQLTYRNLFFGYVKYSNDVFDFVTIAEDLDLSIVVWNARIEGQQGINVTQVTEPTDTSLSVTQPQLAPFLFPNLEEYTYTVTASKTGGTEVDDNLTLDFDTELTKILSIVGLRVVPFTYSPNWDNPIEQSYLWSTDIIKGVDETEQRIKLRQTPRMTVTYSTLTKGSETRALHNLLASWGDRVFVLPLWFDCCKLKNSTSNSSFDLVDVTGTNIPQATLFYVPHTNTVYPVDTVVVQGNSNAIVVNDTFILSVNTDETKIYSLPDVSQMLATVTFGANTSTTITISDSFGTVLDTVTNVPAGTVHTYWVAGNSIKIKAATGLIIISDIDISLTDNSEEATITTNTTNTDTIPTGSKVYPCVLAYLRGVDGYLNHTDDLSETTLTFATDPLEVYPVQDLVSLYLGDPVETVRPLWNDGLGKNIKTSLFLDDYKYGKLASGTLTSFIGGRVDRAEAVHDNRRLKHLLSDLYTRAGKLNIFWLPTYTSDIIINSVYGAGDVILTVNKENNSLLFSQSQDYRNIRIEMVTGEIFYRQITNAIDVGLDVELTINTSLGTTYNPEDFKMISYMSLVRNSSDSVTLVWDTAGFATVEQQFEGVLQ